jgi:cobaltochelatase CobT
LEFALPWIDLFSSALVALIVLSLLWPLRKYLRRPVRFDPRRPYQVYSRDFDVTIEADALDAFMGAISDPDREWSKRFPDVEPRQLPDVERDLVARRVRMDESLQQAVTRIRAEASQDILDDTIVSLLIDHSGSMRGQPILAAARAVMAGSDLLGSLGVKQEVLGFTTVRWKGGQSREKWLRDGQPSYPGRLNDLLHVIYCSVGERLQARHCTTMLRPDLVKENIDGEAIEWAVSRLRQRAERRKCLIVMSDGAPVDDSTLLTNGAGYLDHHLRSVVRAIEQAGDIKLAAIGICHPVGQYFSQSITHRGAGSAGRRSSSAYRAAVAPTGRRRHGVIFVIRCSKPLTVIVPGSADRRRGC